MHMSCCIRLIKLGTCTCKFGRHRTDVTYYCVENSNALQWNLSNTDTVRTTESILIKKASLIHHRLVHFFV